MTTDFVLPDYASGSLANLLPGIIDRLDGSTPVMDLPAARRYVVLLVDGLGWEQLRDHADHAERMSALCQRRITCGIPSTTATSLTSLGCGTTPGAHGVVGYSFYEPTVDTVINALSWEGGPEDVEAFRQVPTHFRRMLSTGRSGAAVTLGRFADSALTRLGFDGTALFDRPEDDEVGHTAGLVADAVAASEVTYVYERLLDHTGHGYGVGSWQWLDRLAEVDDLVGAVTALASDDVCVLVTGDHGMVNVPLEHRVVAEDEPGLAGFTHLGGEGRLRQLYTDDARGLARAWRSFLGERAEVVLRQDAIDAGWFGPEVTARSAARIGDVLVAMRSDWAVMSTRYPGEFGLVGMHGSLTAPEMYVPLLVAGGRG